MEADLTKAVVGAYVTSILAKTGLETYGFLFDLGLVSETLTRYGLQSLEIIDSEKHDEKGKDLKYLDNEKK